MQKEHKERMKIIEGGWVILLGGLMKLFGNTHYATNIIVLEDIIILELQELSKLSPCPRSRNNNNANTIQPAITRQQ
jgi:hypothetical protein